MRALLLTAVAACMVAGTAPAAARAPVVVAKIKVAKFAQPCATAGGGGFVWVSEYARPYLLRIDPKSNKVLGRTMIGGGSCGLAYGAGSLWIEDTNTSTVSRVSARTRTRVAIRVGSTPYDTTFGYGAAWTTAYGGGDLERIDPARNRVVRRWPLPNAVGVVAAFGSIWATGLTSVIRVDPASNAVLATIPVTGGAAWTAASADAVWITTPTSLLRIDPQTNTVVTTVRLPAAPGDPDVVDGQVWVPIVKRNEVLVVDPGTNAVASTIRVGTGPFVVTQIGGDAWVPSYRGADIWRLKP